MLSDLSRRVGRAQPRHGQTPTRARTHSGLGARLSARGAAPPTSWRRQHLVTSRTAEGPLLSSTPRPEHTRFPSSRLLLWDVATGRGRSVRCLPVRGGCPCAPPGTRLLPSPPTPHPRGRRGLRRSARPRGTRPCCISSWRRLTAISRGKNTVPPRGRAWRGDGLGRTAGSLGSCRPGPRVQGPPGLASPPA